ncbi:MAG: phosphoadenylyl-sulfate reductase [Bacteroidia bacterium]|nr:phosphoadenylyl-sulfate reductase [Bacteroidia bacterium]
MKIKTLCEAYSPYDHRKRLEEAFNEFDRVLVTSSFGTTSAILLHLLSKVKPDMPVYMVNTGYLFPETIAYKDTLQKKFNLNIIEVEPKKNEHLFTRLNYTWAHHSDLCCHFNKVEPMNSLKENFDLWISGMLGGTNTHRDNMPLFKNDNGLTRFYPLVDMSPEEAQAYQIIYEIPKHPLEAKGYGSVGCKHCTVKGSGRSGRWAGQAKTECGLHIIQAKS